MQAVKDLNLDGHLDIVALNYYASEIYIYLGNGQYYFEMHTIYLMESDFVRSITIINFNNDSYPDIITAFPRTVQLYLNTGQCSNNLSENFQTSTEISH